MERFTSNYKRFFDSVKSIVSKDFWDKNKPSLPSENIKQLDLFVLNWYPHMEEMSKGNLKYFETKKIDPFVFENLNFLKLTNELSVTNKNVIIEYIHSLYALSISNKYTKENFKNNEDIKKSIDNFAELVSNMVTWRRDKKENEKKTKNPLNESFLENSSIAKLAKEISDEINPTEIIGDDLKNINNPMQIFQSLLSGDKQKGIGKLMTTVCDKLKTKMESGDIKQEELLEEATSLLGKMGGLGGGKGNSNLGNMMSMMQNLSSMGDLFKGPNKQRSRKMKRRLKKKLRRKKN